MCFAVLITTFSLVDFEVDSTRDDFHVFVDVFDDDDDDDDDDDGVIDDDDDDDVNDDEEMDSRSRG